MDHRQCPVSTWAPATSRLDGIPRRAFLVAALFSLAVPRPVAAACVGVAMALNQSTPTSCAEVDNVLVYAMGPVRSFMIEARHPRYLVGEDSCLANFANCEQTGEGYPFEPEVRKLFDNGITVVEGVREERWWRPNGMTLRVDKGPSMEDVHYLRIYRKIEGAAEWPQVFVLYMDGHLRLIPQPPEGRTSVCFGSSVIVGPTRVSDRPIAEIESVRYVSRSGALKVSYLAGGSATIKLRKVSRDLTSVKVSVRYPTDRDPFAALTSMFVSDGNSDVDHVEWEGPAGGGDDPILDFTGGPGTEWRFYRRVRSVHNSSAPDVTLRKLCPPK